MLRWAGYARLFQGSRRLLTISVLFAVVQSALLIPVAGLVKGVFDTKIPDGDQAAVALTGVLILLLYLASAGFGLLTRYSVLKATRSAIIRLRMRLLERIYALPQSYFDRHSLGRLHAIVVQDSERLDLACNAFAAQLLPALMVSLGLCAVALVLNPLLFGALLCVVPMLIPVGRALGRAVRARTRVFQRDFDTFSSQTATGLRAITLTKAHGAERGELEKRAKQLSELGDSGRAMSWRRGQYSIVQSAIAASAGAVVLVIGGWATAGGSMSLGELLGFYAIVALLLRQLTLILTNVPILLSGYESVDRLDGLLEANDREPYSGTRPIGFRGRLTLDSVSFSYGGEPLLRDVSLNVEPGERVAVVGPNGAGKSTLVSLILGLYRPQRGRLLADGVPYDELELTALRRRMGVVLQDPVIFPGTVAQNIAYGRPDATDAEIREAAEWATADHVVASLPDGYATEVGDEGGLLSGGQRQRIAVARALIGQPALLILDEPTTHLDDAAIAGLIANLIDLPGSPALLVISHDPEVARLADSFYGFRDGRLVSDASPGGAAAIRELGVS